MLGFTVVQDFEGDQFTFFKVPPEDLQRLYGVVLQELSIYDAIERHVATQVARGRLCLMDADPYWLPDTRELTYRLDHGKTTIGVNRIDLAARRLEYFHNAGYFALEGEDFDGLFGRDRTDGLPYLPYTEFAKFSPLPGGDPRSAAQDILRRHLAQKPKSNPVAAFRAAVAAQAQAVADREPAFFHQYAFNTLRQLGANFQLLGDHLVWLNGADDPAAAHARGLSANAKTAQFHLARACARRKFDGLPATLDSAVEAWDALFERLEA